MSSKTGKVTSKQDHRAAAEEHDDEGAITADKKGIPLIMRRCLHRI